MNLQEVVPGILLGFFVASVLVIGYTNMATSFGTNVAVDNSSFTFNNSLNVAQQIENKTISKGIDNQNTFFPALGTLFDVWNLIRSSIKDMTQTIENLVIQLGGDALLVLLKTIIIACIALGITFVVLAALFRMGSWKVR